jgi:hypothetical protein
MIEESLIQLEIELDEWLCFIRPEMPRPWPNTDNETDPVVGIKPGLMEDSEVGNKKTLVCTIELCTSTVIKAKEFKEDDDEVLLETDDSDDQTELGTVVEPNSSTRDREENDMCCPNADKYIDPVAGERSPATLDNDGGKNENVPLKVEN